MEENFEDSLLGHQPSTLKPGESVNHRLSIIFDSHLNRVEEEEEREKRGESDGGALDGWFEGGEGDEVRRQGWVDGRM